MQPWRTLTDSLVEDNVKTSFDSTIPFRVMMILILVKLRSRLKVFPRRTYTNYFIHTTQEYVTHNLKTHKHSYNINLGEIAQCMALNESIHRRAVVRNVRESAKALIATSRTFRLQHLVNVKPKDCIFTKPKRRRWIHKGHVRSTQCVEENNDIRGMLLRKVKISLLYMLRRGNKISRGIHQCTDQNTYRGYQTCSSSE